MGRFLHLTWSGKILIVIDCDNYSNPTGKAKCNSKIHSNNSEEDRKRERKKQKSSKTNRKQIIKCYTHDLSYQ